MHCKPSLDASPLNSSLVPLIQGLCSSNPYGFELSVLHSHLFLGKDAAAVPWRKLNSLGFWGRSPSSYLNNFTPKILRKLLTLCGCLVAQSLRWCRPHPAHIWCALAAGRRRFSKMILFSTIFWPSGGFSTWISHKKKACRTHLDQYQLHMNEPSHTHMSRTWTTHMKRPCYANLNLSLIWMCRVTHLWMHHMNESVHAHLDLSQLHMNANAFCHAHDWVI